MIAVTHREGFGFTIRIMNDVIANRRAIAGAPAGAVQEIQTRGFLIDLDVIDAAWIARRIELFAAELDQPARVELGSAKFLNALRQPFQVVRRNAARSGRMPAFG